MCSCKRVKRAQQLRAEGPCVGCRRLSGSECGPSWQPSPGRAWLPSRVLVSSGPGRGSRFGLGRTGSHQRTAWQESRSHEASGAGSLEVSSPSWDGRASSGGACSCCLPRAPRAPPAGPGGRGSESTGTGKLVDELPVRVLLRTKLCHWGLLAFSGPEPDTSPPFLTAAVCAGCPSVLFYTCGPGGWLSPRCPPTCTPWLRRHIAVLSSPQPGASQELGHVPPPSPAIWGSGWGLRGSCAGGGLVGGSRPSCLARWVLPRPSKHRGEVWWEDHHLERPRTPWMSIWGKVVAEAGRGCCGPDPCTCPGSWRWWQRQGRSPCTSRTAAGRGSE